MKNQKAIENLVTMVQTEEKAKIFRMDYPVSEELKGEMVNKVFCDFMIYALDQYYHEENISVLEEFVEEYKLKEDKKESLLQNLFWWQLLNHPGQIKTKSCINEYIYNNFTRLRNRPFIKSWLKKCDKAEPNFYFIGEQFDDALFVAIDLLSQKPHLVIVCDPTAIPPKHGELAWGTLLPLGGGLFFPIIDFYHFDYESREAMASCFHYHYEKYSKKYDKNETFLHVLSIMLEIERIISLEKQSMQK
jgi:hypothetical protein